jgi:hypothetical protein
MEELFFQRTYIQIIHMYIHTFKFYICTYIQVIHMYIHTCYTYVHTFMLYICTYIHVIHMYILSSYTYIGTTNFNRTYIHTRYIWRHLWICRRAFTFLHLESTYDSNNMSFFNFTGMAYRCLRIADCVYLPAYVR